MTSPAVRIAPPTGTPSELHAIGFTDRTWDTPWNIARGHRTMAERMPTAHLSPGVAMPWSEGPSLDIERTLVADPLLDESVSIATLLDQRIMNDGLLVVHKGGKILERYANAFSSRAHHVVHSCSKTLTAMLVGWAIDNTGLTMATPVTEFISELASLPAWQGVTLQHLLDMSAGFDTEEHYENEDSMYWRYAEAVGYYGPTGAEVGVLTFAERELTHRTSDPGLVFNYASYLSNLIPIMIERASSMDYLTLLHSHLFEHIGAEEEALINVDVFDRPIVEGQVSLTLRDFARWAFLLLNGGRNVAGAQVLPEWWVTEAFTPDQDRASAFQRSEYASVFPGAQYHNQAWLIEPDKRRLAMLGIHGQFAYIDRDCDLLIVGMSSFPDQTNALLASYMQSLWTVITQQVV